MRIQITNVSIKSRDSIEFDVHTRVIDIDIFHNYRSGEIRLSHVTHLGVMQDPSLDPYQSILRRIAPVVREHADRKVAEHFAQCYSMRA